MQSIKALSLAPDARDWLANSRHPRILHVFDRACNFINECREVLSIVTPQIGNGPFNLVIQEDVRFSEHLSLESLISVFPTQLNLGHLTINTDNAKLWSPRPDWEMLHNRRYDILGQLMSLRATIESKQSPFESGIASQREAMTLPQLPITNYQSSNSLISSITNADLPSSLTATQKLAGLGIGLTPAGDDFIIGAVLAAWIIHPPEIARVLAKEVTEVAAPLTTSLSAAWLRSAGRGAAGILWHKFFESLLTGNSFSIQVQITKLLSVGHTSGEDALAGFLGVFTAWAGVFRGELRPTVIR